MPCVASYLWEQIESHLLQYDSLNKCFLQCLQNEAIVSIDRTVSDRLFRVWQQSNGKHDNQLMSSLAVLWGESSMRNEQSVLASV